MPSATDFPKYGDMWSFGRDFPVMFIGVNNYDTFSTYWLILAPDHPNVGQVHLMLSWHPNPDVRAAVSIPWTEL